MYRASRDCRRRRPPWKCLFRHTRHGLCIFFGRPSYQGEMAERGFDRRTSLRRAGIDALRGWAIVCRPEREAVQLLDVRDPARPRTEAVTGVDVRADVGIGGRTSIRAARPAPERWPRTWFHIGSNVCRCIAPPAIVGVVVRLGNACSCILVTVDAYFPGRPFNQGVLGSIPRRLTTFLGTYEAGRHSRPTA